MKVALLSAVILTAVWTVTGAEGVIQSPIPVLPTEPGTRWDAAARNAKVKVEAFLELHCPDSAAAFPVLQQVADHYGPTNVDVIIHHFPLPYHRWAFVATQGFYLVKDLQSGKEFDYMTTILENLSDYSSSATADMTYNDVVSMLAVHANQATGISSSEFTGKIDEYSSENIFSWKYACRRGAAGTPWFFVNGVDLAISPSVRLTLDDWKAFLDPLLGNAEA